MEVRGQGVDLGAAGRGTITKMGREISKNI
jgi:hypothetical protein